MEGLPSQPQSQVDLQNLQDRLKMTGREEFLPSTVYSALLLVQITKHWCTELNALSTILNICGFITCM